MNLLDKFSDLAKRVSKNNAGEKSSASVASGELSGSGNSNELGKGHNVAEMICYHHKNGMSVEQIASLIDYEVEIVTATIEEAKGLKCYDTLAKAFTEDK